MSPVDVERHIKFLKCAVLRPFNTPLKGGGDRFIPVRPVFEDEWQSRYSDLKLKHCHSEGSISVDRTVGRSEDMKDCAAFRALLRNELLSDNIDGVRHKSFNSAQRSRGLFRYIVKRVPKRLTVPKPYCLAPLSQSTLMLLRSTRKPARKIYRVPYKVLDAPELQDDFYLNLVDWSSQNLLAVGLASSVYLWNAFTSHVTKLCDLTADADSITSVNWSEKGETLAVGTQRGYCQIWDVASQKKVLNLEGHSLRVGCLAWNGDLVCSGSRDRLILQRDTRISPLGSARRLASHKQEICGLKWSPDHQYLASGGNDNRLLVWDLRSARPVQTYGQHLAAVKAIVWSPHHHGLLTSGGGTADRCMRFWNTLTAQPMQSIDTGSQVCNIAWSKHSSELVSTHGYSQNQIIIWKYPSLQQVAKLVGHTYRVLYLATSPDGESIVTGAGDETLRFWRVFNKEKSKRVSTVNSFDSPFRSYVHS